MAVVLKVEANKGILLPNQWSGGRASDPREAPEKGDLFLFLYGAKRADGHGG